MNSLNKFILLFVFVFVIVFIPKAYSQNNADPGIGILMSPASETLGSTGILSATVGNYGNQTIAANSLRVTISVGADAEILSIASGSDARWSQLTLTTGSANTIRLTNLNTGFGPFDVGDILLTVRGNVVSGPDVILGNIVYITAQNPAICGACSPVPLNASQGNARNVNADPSISNDNSSTSLAVTSDTDPQEIFIRGTVFYDYDRNSDVNGPGTVIPPGIRAVLVQVNADTTEEVIAVHAVPSTGSPTLGQYEFNALSGTTYYVMLTATTPTVGQTPPLSSSLPGPYVSTGENIGPTGNDGLVDGESVQFTTPITDVIDVNFGIIRFESITVD